jgi:hypothetical protein
MFSVMLMRVRGVALGVEGGVREGVAVALGVL